MTEEAALLAADRAARAAALDPERSFIVQAPAGSGKTELLIQRYLRLLATVAEPEEILAITFTRKAAAEMRLRVVEALESARAGERFEQPHRQLTATLALAALARDGQRDWGLLENPARMRMLTIDSFNASIARLLPLSTGSGVGGATLAEDNEMLVIYRQAAAATLDWLATDEVAGTAVRDVLLHMDTSTGVYIDQVAAMLASRDQWLPFVRSGRLAESEAARLRRTFEQHLWQVVSAGIAAASAALPAGFGARLLPLAAYAAASRRDAGAPEGSLRQMAGAASLPGDTPEDLPGWLAMADFLLTNDGKLRRGIDVRHGFPPRDTGQKTAMRELLASLEEHPRFVEALARVRELPPVRYADEQWAVLLSLFRVLPVATYELRRICLARGIADHIEVAMSAAEALGTPEEPGTAALLMDYALRHILVDEMQDTSRAQYRLLESLTAGWEPGDGRTLFCVGDPMQSIYRFRNAEVMQFLRARREGIGSVSLEGLLLRQNFRSGEHLVDWFNASFPHVFPQHDDPGHGAVSYAEAVPAPSLAGQGHCVVHPLFGDSAEAEARYSGDLVRSIVGSTGDESVAVLVRSRTQLPALLRHLRSLGVAYQSVDIDRLTDLPEVLDILALTRALVHPGDRLAWLGVLRAPWIGLDWTDLHALVCNSTEHALLELLRDPERIAQLSAGGRAAIARSLPVIESALRPDRSVTLHRRVERCWYRLGGPAIMPTSDAVENVYRFLDTLARLETGGTLPDVADLYTQLDAERVSASLDARVQIMTMHKAKGLQFDHVVLHATGRSSAGNRPALMNWLDLPDSGDADDKLVSPVGPRDVLERDPVHRYIEKAQAAKDAHEQARLLYVACTRARKSLHIVGHVGLRDEGAAFREPRASTHLRLLWPIVESDYAGAFAEPRPMLAEPGQIVFAEPQLRRFSVPWELPEAPALAAMRDVQPDSNENPRVEYDWVGFDARLAGTIVHRWLHWFAQGRQTDALALPPGFDALTNRWLAELGAAEASRPAIAGRARAAIEGMLSDARGCWILAGEGDAELALTGSHDGRLHSIVIDRVRIDEEGTHWIVDYKTSSHEGGDLEGFLHTEAERYRPQLDRYAHIYSNFSRAPVRCALYFPLLQRFVALPPA